MWRSSDQHPGQISGVSAETAGMPSTAMDTDNYRNPAGTGRIGAAKLLMPIHPLAKSVVSQIDSGNKPYRHQRK